MQHLKDKMQNAGSNIRSSLEKLGQSSNNLLSGNAKPLSNRTRKIQIQMQGWSASDKDIIIETDWTRLENLFKKAFCETTGAVVESFDRSRMVVTVVAETSAIERRVEEQLYGGLLYEINRRIETHNTSKNVSFQTFRFIENLPSENSNEEKPETRVKPAVPRKLANLSELEKRPPRPFTKPPRPITKPGEKILNKHSKVKDPAHSLSNTNFIGKDLAHVMYKGYSKNEVHSAAAFAYTSDINAILDALFQRSERKPKHQAVQIVLPNRQQNLGYNINEYEIERIFGHPAVANTPVAIYSLAGAFRKGKSFMLNFFLRYLWAVNNNKSHEWLKSKEEKLNKGFVWRGGSNRDTQGIWIWDEPFFVDTPQGKIALFLMDTQGSFDHKSTVKDCSVIFGLSTLLSSMLIYNVQNQIQEDTLQYLQLFTKYAKLAKQNQQHLERPFQELMFLVRDWMDQDYNYGYGGGERVLQVIMEPQLQHSDTESVRRDLRESFQRITCCLMPHPGFVVAERKEGQGNNLKISEVRDVFLESVDVLVREIFSPQRVVAKTNNKKPVTGNDLINFTLSYFEVFSSGKMPEVQTIMQATAKASMLMIIQECKDIYKKEMIAKCNKYLNEAEMGRIHGKCMRRALYAFDEERKLGDDAFIVKYRQNLEENLQQKFAEFVQINKTQKEALKEEIRDILEEARSAYISSLDRHIGDEYIDEQSLGKFDRKYQTESVGYFDNKTAHLPEIADSYRQKLRAQLALELEKFKESNAHRLNKLQQLLRRNVQNGCTNYKEAMNKKTNEKILTSDEFADAHVMAHDNAVQEFDSAYVGRNILQKQAERKRLLEWINQTKLNYKKNNDTKRELAEKILILETMEEIRKCIYSIKMENYDEDKFQEALLESKEKAERLALSKGFLYWQHKTQFDEFIDNEFLDIKKKHVSYKRKMEEKGKAVLRVAKAAYENHLKSSIGAIYVDEQTFCDVEERSRKKSLEIYKQKASQLPQPMIEAYFNDLEKSIAKHRNDFNQSNNEKLEKMLRDLIKQSDLSVRYYKQIMKSKCAEQIMSDQVFDEAHKQAQTDALGTFDASSIGASSRQRKEAKERLVLLLKESHSSFKATNARNRDQLQEKTVETLKAGISAYQSAIISECNAGYINEKSLEQANENSKKKAKEVVNSVGDKNVVEKCLPRLYEMIDNEFKEAKAKNEEQMEMEIRHKMEKTLEEHCALLKKTAGGKYVEEHLLEGIEQSSLEETVNRYKASTKMYPTKAVETHQVKLENSIFQEWKRFKERNNHKFVEIKHQMDKELENAANKYKSMMEETCSKNILSDEGFEANHQKIQKEVIKNFCNSKLGENTRLRNEEQKRLIETIQLTRNAFKKTNELKRREAEIEAMETLEKATTAYKLAIANICKEKYIDEEILEKGHADSKNKAQQIANSFDKKEVVQHYMSKFEEAISFELQNTRNRNNDLKEVAINQFRQKKLNAYKLYQENTDRATQTYMEENKLQEFHEFEMKKAMEEYTKGGPKEPKDDFESLQFHLGEEIVKHYQLICKRNNDLKWQLEEKGEKYLQELKTVYLKIMDELCKEAYLEPVLLQESHQLFKNEVEKKFAEYIGKDFSTIVNKFAERCCKELDELFKDVEDQNKRNKEVYVKKRRKKIGDVVGGIGGLIGGILGMLAGPTGIKSGVDIGKAVGRWLGEHLAKLAETKA